jgi:REP element-mobilizing transposase RayT
VPYADLRKGRRSILGQAYLLTTATFRRRQLLVRLPAIAVVARTLLALEREGAWALHAWVVMPDHVHLVATLERANLSVAMRLLKGRSSRCLRANANVIGPVWQPGFHDHALRTTETARAAALYVCANPLRAGLAESLRLYPGWDAPAFRAECGDLEFGPTEVGPTAPRGILGSGFGPMKDALSSD